MHKNSGPYIGKKRALDVDCMIPSPLLLPKIRLWIQHETNNDRSWTQLKIHKKNVWYISPDGHLWWFYCERFKKIHSNLFTGTTEKGVVNNLLTPGIPLPAVGSGAPVRSIEKNDR